jgi:hypothetical protein
MAAVNYASKKTPSTITISITSLEGSATMNNTLGLLIFLILIFAKVSAVHTRFAAVAAPTCMVAHSSSSLCLGLLFLVFRI